MTLSLTSPHFIRLQETKVNLLNRLVQNCKAGIIRCYLHTYLLSYLPSYLPKYLPTYLHTLMSTCTYHYFCLCIFRLPKSVKKTRKAASFGSCDVENGNYKNSNILFLSLQYCYKKATSV